MFQGTGKKGFNSKTKYTKRKIFNGGEDHERVELYKSSGGSSPHGYDNFSIDQTSHRQENKSPQQSPMFRDGSTERNCHQGYNEKIEHPSERREHRTRPGKTRQASPIGKIWTPNALRGLHDHLPSPHKGDRYVLSPSKQLEEKEKDEHLSLRFAHMPMTKCPYYLHYHGFDYEHDPPVRGSSLFGSMEAPEFFPHPGDEWWKNSGEEHSCGRCLSHHKKCEKGEKRRAKEDQNLGRMHFPRGRKTSRRQNMIPSDSSTEFTTPREEVITSI